MWSEVWVLGGAKKLIIRTVQAILLGEIVIYVHRRLYNFWLGFNIKFKMIRQCSESNLCSSFIKHNSKSLISYTTQKSTNLKTLDVPEVGKFGAFSIDNILRNSKSNMKLNDQNKEHATATQKDLSKYSL